MVVNMKSISIFFSTPKVVKKVFYFLSQNNSRE